MKVLHCPACQTRVYFKNSLCLQCHSQFGFAANSMQMATFGDGTSYKACANRAPIPVCNWLVAANDPHGLCESCRLTSTIAPLSNKKNLSRWITVENAKRRLLYSLRAQGISLLPKQSPFDLHGVEFRWLEGQNGQQVITGHENGVITLNIEEVDDGQRELERERLNENMRTVLGHLRHETSHHLYQRFVENRPSQQTFRQVFGDDTADYGQALAKHYDKGAPADWSANYISAYASCHPLEDWAETAAHFLLMLDALETAQSERMELQGWTLANAQPASNLEDAALLNDEAVTARLVTHEWLPLTRFLNAMSRSLGQRDYYPYVLSDAVIRKLSFVRFILLAASDPGRVV